MNKDISYRKIDEVGRLEIPLAFRKKLKIEEDIKSWMELQLEGDSIIVKKKQNNNKSEVL